MTTSPAKILYLVHDLNDPAVMRRVMMLRKAGASVIVSGFYRGSSAPAQIAGAPAIALGQTKNGQFIDRVLCVLKTLFTLNKYRTDIAASDVIVARNLEMLALAVRARSLVASKRPAIVYEVLDIHRLMLRDDLIGKSLRALEGWLGKRVSLLWTSSPAFVEHYFKPRSKLHLPVRLIENKVYDPDNRLPATLPARPDGPPWVIGWFGVIRCRKSLAILRDLVIKANGKVRVIIRGRPAYDQFEDFDRDVTNLPSLEFKGPYNYATDLPDIYREVHFTWAIDYFEEGQNSSWLLPNRLYEGCALGSIPIALTHVAVGQILAHKKIGVRCNEPLLPALQKYFDALTPEFYQQHLDDLRNIPRSEWVMADSELNDTVKQLANLGAGS